MSGDILLRRAVGQVLRLLEHIVRERDAASLADRADEGAVQYRLLVRERKVPAADALAPPLQFDREED